MPIILGSDKTGVTRRVNETVDKYIFDGVPYDKTTMNPVLFKNLSDLGDVTSIGTYQSLNPFSQTQYWNGRMENTFVQDINNPNITWEIDLRYNLGGNIRDYGDLDSRVGVNKIDTNTNTITRCFYTLPADYNSYYGVVGCATSIIGQSEDYLYVTIVKGYSASSSGYNYNIYSGYINNYIFAISKNNLEDEKTYSISDTNYFKNICGSSYTFNNPIVLKETKERIYLLNNYSHYSSGYEYECFYIDKKTNTQTQIKYFNINDLSSLPEGYSWDYSNNYGNGVQLTKAVEIDTNTFDIYGVSFGSKTEDSGKVYKNFINKINIKINEDNPSETVIKMSVVNTSEEPFFTSKYSEKMGYGSNLETQVSTNYNISYERLYYLTKDSNKYLLTMNNVYYNSDSGYTWKFSTKAQADKNIIALYKLEESPDSASATLLAGLKIDDLEPAFYGGILNEKFNSMLAIGRDYVYMIEIDLDNGTLNCYKQNLQGRAIGLDKNGNAFVQTADFSVYIIPRNNPTNIIGKIKNEDNLPEISKGETVEVTLEVDSFNYKLQRLATPLVFKIDGNAVFNENQQKVLKKTTLTTGSLEIPITVKEDGEYKVYIDLEIPV